jgi:hypothetical protein
MISIYCTLSSGKEVPLTLSFGVLTLKMTPEFERLSKQEPRSCSEK